jgi:hypothetical protein
MDSRIVMIRSARLDLEAYSARPDAPVVPYVEPRHPVLRTRTAVAAGLRRLADRTAPARPLGEAGTLGC